MSELVRLRGPEVIQVSPGMVGEPHDWREIDYWQYPLWKCRRCKMQTKDVVAADARRCYPTKRGQCRICHESAATKTSLYCRRHYRVSHVALKKQRPLSDAQILALHEDGTSFRSIAERLGVSVVRARQIVHTLKWQRELDRRDGV